MLSNFINNFGLTLFITFAINKNTSWQNLAK